jgi:hypothetical protein
MWREDGRLCKVAESDRKSNGESNGRSGWQLNSAVLQENEREREGRVSRRTEGARGGISWFGTEIGFEGVDRRWNMTRRRKKRIPRVRAQKSANKIEKRVRAANRAGSPESSRELRTLAREYANVARLLRVDVTRWDRSLNARHAREISGTLSTM